MIWGAVGVLLVVVAIAWFLVGRDRDGAPESAPPSSKKDPAKKDAPPSSTRSTSSGKKPVAAPAPDQEEETDVTRMGKVPSLARLESKDDEGDSEPPIEVEEEEVPEESAELTGPNALILVTAVARTDPGKVRKHNEDSHLAMHDEPLYVVADGMGGYAGGEVASKIAVDTIAAAFKARKFPGLKRRTRHRRGNELVRAIELANDAILKEAKANPDLRDMGTTIAAARFSPNKRRAYVASVGDSRVYRVRDGKMEQLTKDHTLAAEIGLRGAMGAQLSRAVGVGKHIAVDLLATDAQVGDVFLVCSDGLTKMISDDGIAKKLEGEATRDLQAAAEGLVSEANARGGRDNVTVVLIRIDTPKV